MSKTTLLYCFLGGAVVGATAAVLFAPRKGSEMRRLIKEKLQKKGILCTESEIDSLVAQLTADFDD